MLPLPGDARAPADVVSEAASGWMTYYGVFEYEVRCSCDHPDFFPFLP